MRVEPRLRWRDLYRLLSARLDPLFSPSSYAYRWENHGVDLCQSRIAATLARPAAGPSVERAGSFDPGSHRITIRYRNFQGDDVEFEADGRTVRFVKDHLSVCVVPTGRRIALAKKFIRNLNDLEPASETAARLSAVDRQILGYHRKHGTTSARYEALLRQYPDLSGSS